MAKKPVLKGEGHVLLSFFNIDYHESIEDITSVLMENPTGFFKLTLTEITKKTKGPAYIQPDSVI